MEFLAGDRVVARDGQAWTKAWHFKKAADELRRAGAPAWVTADAVRVAVLAFESDERPMVVYSREELCPEEVEIFVVRGIDDKGARSQYATFEEALAAPTDARDPVVEWRDTARTAAVDLDFHAGGAPPAHDLEAAAATVSPRPSWWWVTRGGGLRLVYQSRAGMEARDLAHVAAFQLSARWPSAGVEVLHRTRRPPGECHKVEPDADCGYLARFYGGEEVDRSVVDDWLAQRGMEIGGRYPHSLCPINPHTRAECNADPVQVFPDGVHCYVCQADGLGGQASWGRLCGERVSSLLRVCVDKMTNWDHARYVLAQAAPGLPPALAPGVYRAMLRRKHGQDLRVPLVFHVAREKGLVRMNGYWAARTGEPLALGPDNAIIRELPAVLQPDLSVDAARASWFNQGVRLDEFGYPPLSIIWGIRLTRYQELPPDRVHTVLHTTDFRQEAASRRRPRYIPARDRMPEEDAWRKLERVFPRLRRDVVELLVAAKGCSEHCAGLPPMVFLSGPSGAGKSASVAVAAGICGDCPTKIPYSADVDKFFSAVREARSRGSYAVFDEFVKGAKGGGRGASTAMEVLLNFDPRSVTHKLYTGPVPLGDLPVFVWTDTEVPVDVQEHSQVGRRVHHVRFAEEVHWEPTLAAYGIDDPCRFRLAGEELCTAADSILSAVVDRYFTGRAATDFAAVAQSLGVRKLRDSEAAREKILNLRRLFDWCCTASPLEGRDAARWPGEGWRLIELNRDGEGQELWSAVADGEMTDASRTADETDLMAALDLSAPARLERRRHGYRLAVRFASLEGEIYNGGLKHDQVELAPRSGGVDGHGDAVRVEPPGGGFPGLPPSLLDAPPISSLPDAGQDGPLDSAREGPRGGRRLRPR